MKKALVVLFAMLLVLGTAAAAFAQEGVLYVLCTPQEEWCQGMEEEFEAVYPEIDVQWNRLSSGEALARVQAEKGNPSFDVWWGGPMDAFIAAKAEGGLLAQYESPSLANVLEKFQYLVDVDHYYAPIYMGTIGFMTNTNWLEAHPGVEAPTSYYDLLKPEYKGQVMISHPSTAGTGYTFLSSVLQVMGEEDGWKYMRDLNDQVYQYTKSGSAAGNNTNEGQTATSVVFSHDAVKFIDDKGAPCVLTFPKEGTGYEVAGVAILEGAKNLENAQLWYDWALTADAQKLGPRYASYQAPTVEGVELSHPELLECNLINYDFQWSGDHKQEFQDKFSNEIQNREDVH